MSSVLNIKKRYILPLVLFSLYMLNVIATKVQLASGTNDIIRVNDVFEFILLILASLTFVVAMLLAEKDASQHSAE
ncbi:hypothetical protein L4D06_05225 [Enterovibrio makurazakiensis]|uniref:Uncharacterized protein n=1 Tax=Enterovibrio gelatinilyticus TaxID=2899819 RepID=A0ABT5QZ36_9GAMM|nr:hypothetical protein [Enterovibrio sp. ZSDZ42]MDD1793282.1 hypothetical protein [Enterovibrio sp. ZSDZ42]